MRIPVAYGTHGQSLFHSPRREAHAMAQPKLHRQSLREICDGVGMRFHRLAL